MISGHEGESGIGASLRGYAVHVYTAAGIVPALFAALEIVSPSPDPRVAFAWLAVAVVIDATDGPLARRFRVEKTAPRVRGRTLDDIIDFLTFTFLPLLLVWRMSWVGPPRTLWVALAMFASLFGFAHVGAKEDDGGFFRGFPSYWNVFAFYAGIVTPRFGTGILTVAMVGLSVLTLIPVRFVYPNRAPRPWKQWLIVGGLLWLAVIVAMLATYPVVPASLFWVSFAYPVVYVVASGYLSRARSEAAAPRPSRPDEPR